MKISQSESLSKHTSFRTGGRARFFVEIESGDELADVVSQARLEGLPYLILGEGSNVLINDADFDGYVIRPLVRGIEFTDDNDSNGILVVAGAGEHWDDLVAETVAKNLSGLENLSWIPGSVGAAPVQNIGAYGSELKDVLEWVEVFDPKESGLKILNREVCRFDYRDSLFKSSDGRGLIITRLAVRLKENGNQNILYKDLARYFDGKSQTPSVAEVRAAVIKIRQDKLPDIKKYGTAGSFFKNPIISETKYAELIKKYPSMPSFSAGDGFRKIPLAWILDKVCGLNGFREGNVGLYETQPLALVNFGEATTTEIKNFAEKISGIVKEKTDLNIEWEVNLI